MGMDVISGVTNTQSYQGAGLPVKAAQETVEENAGSEQAILQKQAAEGQNVAAEQPSAGKETDKQQSATMKDFNAINKLINSNTVAEFGYNEPTNRITIKIKDKETDEVIKEIPSEKALEMLAKVWELAGMLVDEKR